MIHDRSKIAETMTPNAKRATLQGFVPDVAREGFSDYTDDWDRNRLEESVTNNQVPNANISKWRIVMCDIGENEFHQVMEIVNDESDITGVTCKKGDTIYREPNSDYPYRYIVLCNNGRDALEVRKEEGDAYWQVVKTIIWQGKKP